jgi:hypothetical protein
MNVLLLSPGFPAEMPLFTRGLANVGARALGVGDQPLAALDPKARASLSDYLQVESLWDEAALVRQVGSWLRGRELDRVECLWEPGMIVAARLREAFGVPGLSVERTVPFRDKEKMKQVLDAAGVRTPRHARARTAGECREAAERIGYPLIIKPIAGAGSADTYPLREPADLERAIGLLSHVEEVSVEEYIEGEEFTFDTVCASGRVLFENVAWYRPKPLLGRLNAWINPQSVCLRDIEVPQIRAGRNLGRAVLEALGFESGFTHMEWFLTPSGEAVFGEIGGRPPGGRLVHAMNYSCDIDLFSGWAEAITAGRFSQDARKKYNAAVIFKRGEGEGIVRRIEGLEALLARYGEHVAALDLVRVGEPRRDWRQVIIGDGWIAVRHPNLEYTLEMADHFSTDLRIYAG